jgi:hypothetical protein
VNTRPPERQLQQVRSGRPLDGPPDLAGVPKRPDEFPRLILAQCLSALSQAAILFFACGLTLIFGIMRIVNLRMASSSCSARMSAIPPSPLPEASCCLDCRAIVVGAVGMAFERSSAYLYGRRDGGAYLCSLPAVVLSELIR